MAKKRKKKTKNNSSKTKKKVVKKKVTQKKKGKKKSLVSKTKNKTRKAKSGGVKEFKVNEDFTFFRELKSLINKAAPDSLPKFERKIKRVGQIKLLVTTGVFINYSEARVDLLVVGEKINLNRFTKLIKDVESELGQEIRYIILSNQEFVYRYDMFDRFLRDVLESPHQKIINRLKI